MKKQRNLLLTAIVTTCMVSACNSGTTTGEMKDTTATSEMASTDTSMQTEAMDDGMMKPIATMMEKMSSTKLTGDFDNDFAALMIEHHQGAVDLSEMEVSKGADAGMKKIAQTMIDDHKAEIAALQKFIADHGKIAEHKHEIESDHQHADGKEADLSTTMKTENEKMMTMTMTGNPDKDYAMMMKEHHADAIKMSEGEVDHGHHAELKKMAQKMIADDTKEVKEFEEFLSNMK